MADLISGLKFTVFSADDTVEFVPLRRLLITDVALLDTRKNKKGAIEQEEVQDPEKTTVKSRRASRSQRKSRSTPRNFNYPAGGSVSALADLRAAQIRRIQENNNRHLIELQQSLDSSDIVSRTLAGSPDASGLIADLELPPTNQYDSEDIAPVILALVDFLPCYSDGQRTPALRSLELKRAARMLNIDLQTQDSMAPKVVARNDVLQTPIAQALSDHLIARAAFYNSLKAGPSNIPDFSEILGDFALVDQSTSSTEVLYTLMRDIAASFKFGTPRLSESNDRYLGRGRRLPNPLAGSYAPLTADIYDRLSRSFESDDPLSRLTNLIPDDAELFVKSLSAILGKETLYSQNIVANIDDYTDPGTKSFDPNIIDPEFLLGVRIDQVNLAPQPEGATGGHACGVLYRSRINLDDSSTTRANTADNYPYEIRKLTNPIIGDASKVNSAPKFIKDEYAKYINEGTPRTYRSTNGTTFSSPYEATKASFVYGAEKLISIMQPQSASDSSVDRVFRQIVSFTYNNLRMTQDHDLTFGYQPKVFEIAGKRDDLLAKLLIYLAFRQEKKLNYSGIGSAPEGASQLLRKSSWLRSNRLLSVGSGTVMRQQRISPSTITVNPSIEGQSIFTAPERATTIGIELDAASTDSGTLESMFAVTFEEIADEVGAAFYYAMVAEAPQQDQAVDFLDGEGSDLPVLIGTIQYMFRNLVDPAGLVAEDLFDCCLRFTEYLNGHVGLPIFRDAKTMFGGVDREAIFGSFVYLTCVMQRLILPGAGYELKGFHTVEGVDPRTGRSTGTRALAATRSNLARIRKVPGFASKIDALRQFVDDPANSASVLNTNFPELARIYSDLAAESASIYKALFGLHQYFGFVQGKYLSMKSTLDASVEVSKGVTTTLGEKLARGLIPSSDVVKLLRQYPDRLNNSVMYYNRKKVNDNTISNINFRTLNDALSIDNLLSEKDAGDLKIMCIGVPAGLLESLEFVATSFSTLNQESRMVPDNFSVMVQKIDESNPQIQFEELEFKFSRSIFVRQILANKGTFFTVIGSQLRPVQMPETTLRKVFEAESQAVLGYEIIDNHKRDYVLKQYLDLQHDLDLNENAFPTNQEHLAKSISSEIKISAFDSLDFQSIDFLSGSNLAFSDESTRFQSMPFYDRENMTLDISKKSMVSPYRYSAFDYANTYGALFDGTEETDKMKDGLIFEKTVCIAFKDSDFGIDRVIPPVIDLSGLSAEAAAEAAKLNEARAYEQAELVTESADTKMVTYRAYVKLGDVNIIDRLGESS